MTIAFGESLPSSPMTIKFDLSGWAQIEIGGKDARSFLHNFCTNDVQKLADGRACEAFIPDIKGRILGHVLILAAAGRLRLIAVPGTDTTVVPHIQRYLLDADAEIQNRTGDLGLVCLCGRGLEELLKTTLGIDRVPEIGQVQIVQIDTESLWISGAELTPLPTVIVSGPHAAIAALSDRLSAASAASGSPEQFELLRIEAGFPWHGRDVSEANLAQEAGRTQRAISFTKGCYLGQEPIARLDAMGHTNQELRGLLIDGAEIVPGDLVTAASAEVGRISSAAFEPGLGKSVALTMIRIKHAEPGTNLIVKSKGRDLPAKVFWPRLLEEISSRDAAG